MENQRAQDNGKDGLTMVFIKTDEYFFKVHKL